jgi:hypothetical protein
MVTLFVKTGANMTPNKESANGKRKPRLNKAFSRRILI